MEDHGSQKDGRRLPISEVALAIAVVMAIIGMVSFDTRLGRWATIGALIVGLLAGTEIRWR